VRGVERFEGSVEEVWDVRAHRVPLGEFADVVGEDDEPFLLGGHCAGCGCERAGGEEGS